MNIIWIAPPAAGKGTFSNLFKEKYGFNHISAGEVLREEVTKESEIGLEIKDIMNRGEMIDDNIMKKLIYTKLKSLNLSVPFMMDGYPRKMNQVKDYEDILSSFDLNVDKVIFINIDKETGLKRILGRVECPKCKKNYNTLSGFAKPKIDGICDQCGETLVSRVDDTKEAYENRYDTYINETSAVVDYFRSINKLIEIDGTLSPDENIKELEKLLGVENG